MSGFDLVIRGGTVIDGTGGEARKRRMWPYAMG